MLIFSRIGCLNKLTSFALKPYCSSVPKTPTINQLKPDQIIVKTKIDSTTIEHLERLSLVDFGNQFGIRRLEEAIAFADQILHVNTVHVEPLTTVLHEECLHLREDQVTEGFIRDQILANAAVTEEEYFTAPAANIPLQKQLKNLK